MRARVWLVVFLCFLLTLPALSQKFTGIIRGAVTDQSGAVVPGAEVTIKNDATGETRTVTTNDQGEYVAPELAAGVYTITPSGLTSSNYNITFVPGTFTIVDTSKPVVVTFIAFC